VVRDTVPAGADPDLVWAAGEWAEAAEPAVQVLAAEAQVSARADQGEAVAPVLSAPAEDCGNPARGAVMLLVLAEVVAPAAELAQAVRVVVVRAAGRVTAAVRAEADLGEVAVRVGVQVVREESAEEAELERVREAELQAVPEVQADQELAQRGRGALPVRQGNG